MPSIPVISPIRLPAMRQPSTDDLRRFDRALRRIEKRYRARRGIETRTTAERFSDIPRSLLWAITLPLRVSRIERAPSRAFFRLLALSYTNNLHPRYSSLLKRSTANPEDIFDNARVQLFLRWIRAAGDKEQANIVDNKALFAVHFGKDGHGFPLAEEISHITRDQHPVEPRRDINELFVKPSHQQSGRGISYWTRTNDGCWTDGQQILGWEELVEHLRALIRSPKETILLQRRLHNHPEISDLSKASLNTIRILTLVDIRSKVRTPQIIDSFYRMGTGDSLADNTAQGGMVAGIHDGKLTQTIDFKTGKQRSSHPTTQAKIEGRHLPDYDKAIQMAIQAHHTLSDVCAIGWDIALTDTGPVLLEGNTIFDTDCIQILQDPKLGFAEFVRISTPILEDDSNLVADSILNRSR